MHEVKVDFSKCFSKNYLIIQMQKSRGITEFLNGTSKLKIKRLTYTLYRVHVFNLYKKLYQPHETNDGLS